MPRAPRTKEWASYVGRTMTVEQLEAMFRENGLEMLLKIISELMGSTARLVYEYTTAPDGLRFGIEGRLRDTTTKKVEAATTKVIRAFRDAGNAKAFKDADIGLGMWISMTDGRTCPDCWNLHGKVDKLDDLRAHKGHTVCDDYCRCKIIPYTGKSYQEAERLASSIPRIERGAAA